MVLAGRGETAHTKKRVRGIIQTAKDCVHSYLKSKRDAKPDRELIRAAADLAQLDLVYRIGVLDLQRINEAEYPINLPYDLPSPLHSSGN